MIVAGRRRRGPPPGHDRVDDPAAGDRRAGPAQAPRRPRLAALDRADARRHPGRDRGGRQRRATRACSRCASSARPTTRSGPAWRSSRPTLEATIAEKDERVAQGARRVAERGAVPGLRRARRSPEHHRGRLRPPRLAAHALALAEERIAAGAARRPLGADRVPLPRPPRAARPGRGRVEQPLRPGRAHERVHARGPRRRAVAARAGHRRGPRRRLRHLPRPRPRPDRVDDRARSARRPATTDDPYAALLRSGRPSCSTIPSGSATTGPRRTRTSPRSEAAIASGVVTIEEIAGARPRDRHRPRGLGAAAGAPVHPLGSRRPCTRPRCNNATDRFRVLYLHGHHYELQYRYETWVQYMPRTPPGRIDLTPLADGAERARARRRALDLRRRRGDRPALHLVGAGPTRRARSRPSEFRDAGDPGARDRASSRLGPLRLSRSVRGQLLGRDRLQDVELGGLAGRPGSRRGRRTRRDAGRSRGAAPARRGTR